MPTALLEPAVELVRVEAQHARREPIAAGQSAGTMPAQDGH